MAIWLRRDQDGVAVKDGIVRRDAWVHVAELDAAFTSIEESRIQMLQVAEQGAQRILEDAEEAAGERRAAVELEAQKIFDTAQAEGIQAGIDEWNYLAIRRAKESREQLRQQRERMARIVIAAVEKIVPLQDPQGIYRQVLRMLSKSMQTVRYVIVRVCPDELAHAESTIRELSAGSAFANLIDVIADERLATGACLVESDQGIVDLSLTSQLIALRAAIALSVADNASSPLEED